MPLIHQITEHNFTEELEKGLVELNKKFSSLDELRNSKLDKIEFEQKLAFLLRDPTIWAYATLKDKQNNPLKLFPWQDKVINDTNRFVYVNASNQVGKSFCICIKSLHHALHTHNASVMLISKSEQQAVMLLDEIKWLLKRAKIDYSPNLGEIQNRTELQIRGPQGSISIIRSFPPTTAVLGFPSTLTICDEINFWEKINELSPIEYYDQVIEPRSNMTKSWTHPFLTMGQIVFISNPNGKKGIGWRTYSEDKRFNCYSYCWLAYPKNTLEEYEEARKRLPSYRFASIYAAEFVSAEGGFIEQEQYDDFVKYNSPLIIPPGSTLFLGGDFAGEDVKSKNRDDNVLFGVVQVENKNAPNFPRVRVVYYKEWPAGTNKNIIYDEISRLGSLPTITIGSFAYDKVGVGDQIKMDLIGLGILSEYQIESLTYSLPNKSEVFLNAQRVFSLGMIEGREIPKLREQIMALEVTQPEGSVHLKIHHRTETIRDDFCFVAGTLVLTNKGQVPIENLKMGDLVLTRKGFKPIISTGKKIDTE